MTPEQLLEAGYDTFDWDSGGAMREYWKPLNTDPGERALQFKQRLSVQFFEWKGKPFSVWLYTDAGGMPCRSVNTVEQLETLYKLVSGGDEGVGDG